MQQVSQSRPPAGLERVGAKSAPGVHGIAGLRTPRRLEDLLPLPTSLQRTLVKAQQAPQALDDIDEGYLLALLTPPESDRGQDAPISPLDCNVHCPQAHLKGQVQRPQARFVTPPAKMQTILSPAIQPLPCLRLLLI